MSKNIVKEKSVRFAIRIVKLYKFLTDEKHELVMSKQILRSGTSIGANIAESNNAISKKDFLSKLSAEAGGAAKGDEQFIIHC